MKVFITASSGVGKSAVIKELSKRGYTAYDADDRNLKLTRLEVKETGEPAEWPTGFVDWSYYAWNANQERLQELLATDETVFIAGILSNQESFYKYFDKLIVLTVDPTEHERRLRTRPQRKAGDGEQNNKRRLEKYSEHLSKFKASGFIEIDNRNSVAKTVDQILEIVSE